MSEDNGGNGKLTPEAKPEITPEQAASERLARYQKNPDDFIEKSDLVCVAVRSSLTPLGLYLIVGNSKRSELDIAQSELNTRIDIIRRQLIKAEMQMNQSKITPAKGSMFNFARRRR